MRAVALLLLFCACSGGGLRRPEDKNVNLAGTLYIGGVDQRGEVLKNGTVSVTRASDGTQLGTTVTATNGEWKLSFEAAAGTRIVVGFRAPGFAPNFRALAVGPYADVQ